MRYSILWLILLLSIDNAQAQPKPRWIHFDWQGQTIFGTYYPRVAMSIPLQLESLPYPFCAQFDLGATTTMLYGNAFRTYAAKHPAILQKLDTSLGTYYLNGTACYYLKQLNFQLDKTLFRQRNVVYVPHYGDEIPPDSMNTASPKLIGTIAPDLFQNKVLVIDFARNRMGAFDHLPPQYARANFVPSLMRKGRIKVPLQIGDSIRYVLFDTGNCLADLLLDKETIRELTDASETPTVALNGNTWGQSVVYYSQRINRNILLNGRKLNLSAAMYSDQASDVQFNKEEKIIGLMGPLLFANKIIIIDYRRSLFGVL